MALTTHEIRGRRWSRWHFLLRLLGLTGLLVAAVGLVLLTVYHQAPLDNGAEPDAVQPWTLAWLEEPGVYLTLGGSALAGLALLVELGVGLYFLSGRRGAFGSNVAVQIALAVALVVGINFFSFSHYLRFDWTRDHLFTLDETIRQQLSQLRGETTIVVYQLHKSFGQLADKPDMYDYAAERKVVEKVKDLVDQFRELGPQFRVVVLDVEEEGFHDKLKELTTNAPELRAAIDETPENCVFFYAGGKVQRLGFHEIYTLDKKASQGIDLPVFGTSLVGLGAAPAPPAPLPMVSALVLGLAQPKSNLVLYFQGVQPFASKLLNVDEKRPRIAVATIHEVLSMEGASDIGTDLGMRGLQKALTARGFDTRDVLLKKWGGFTGPEPAVFTADENKYDKIEEDLAGVNADIKNYEEGKKELAGLIDLWTKSSLDELTKKYADQLDGEKVTEPRRQRQLDFFRQQQAILELFLNRQREDREALIKEKAGLNVDTIADQRRISDLKAKTDRLLADCDLLILPRLTLLNAPREDYIPNSLYYLDEAQVAAIKDFLRAGKPVLALFGPSNEAANPRMPPIPGPDLLERALTELGFQLPKQTILFNAESKSYAERRGNLLILGKEPDIPPVNFDPPAGAGQSLARESTAESEKPNPIRVSMEVNVHSLGKDQKLDLILRHPRPVYYEAPKGTKLAFQPVFMMTDKACWNENQPFATRERTPRYKASEAGDPAWGTPNAERTGPFSIGVAAETTLPASWYTDKDAKPGTARVAVIGHGGVFVGRTLPPVKEKLLLDTCNWLLGRDNLLTKEENRWQYPRVDLTERDHLLWQWGTRLGLPVLFAYVGLMVLMLRRLR
jgi:hypothetical protein